MVAEDYLKGEPFVMYLGDNLLKQGAKPLIQTFNENQSDCVVGAAEVKDPSRYGVVVFNKDGTINRFVEKPTQRAGAPRFRRERLTQQLVVVLMLES